MKRLIFVLSVLIVATIACEKEEPQHDTTYVWGFEYWTEIWPANKIIASADSTSVRNVFLKNDGKSLSGLNVSFIRESLEPIVNTVPSENRYKIRGAGNLRHLYITDKNDSTWLSQFGFKFIEPRYKDIRSVYFMPFHVDTPKIISEVQQLVNEGKFRIIYIEPAAYGNWYRADAHDITSWRTEILQPCIELSSVVHGKGDFNFKLGEASKVPEDSLWYIQQGWTINKYK